MNINGNTHVRRAVIATVLLTIVLLTAGCGGINHALNGRSLNDRYSCNTQVELKTDLTIDEFAKATKPQGDDLHSWKRLIIQRSSVYGKSKFKKGEVLVLPTGCDSPY